MAKGITAKWRSWQEFTARWRRYEMTVFLRGGRWVYVVARRATRVPDSIVTQDDGFPTFEAAMVAAELAARNDFAKRRKAR
jgi:hypothetical protein